MIAANYVRLFKFQLVEIKFFLKVNSSITLATYQELKSHMASGYHTGQCRNRISPSLQRILLHSASPSVVRRPAALPFAGSLLEADSLALPQICWIRTCIFTSSLGNWKAP